MVQSAPEVLYRLAWQVAGHPEQHVIGKREAISLVEDLLKHRGVHKIDVRVMEATSARLPAPEPELIQSVDHGMETSQGRRHATPRVDEPLFGSAADDMRDRLRERAPEFVAKFVDLDEPDQDPGRGCRGCEGTCCTGINGVECSC